MITTTELQDIFFDASAEEVEGIEAVAKAIDSCTNSIQLDGAENMLGSFCLRNKEKSFYPTMESYLWGVFKTKLTKLNPDNL